MEFLTTGTMRDFHGAPQILMDGLGREKDPVARDPLRDSAAASAFSGNGRVIAAFDHQERIVGWVQLVRLDLLFGPSVAELCRYWGDDEFISTNMFEILLAEAVAAAIGAWDAHEIHTLVCQESILHSFERMEARIVQVETLRWYTAITSRAFSVDACKLPWADPTLLQILHYKRRWKLIRY